MSLGVGRIVLSRRWLIAPAALALVTVLLALSPGRALAAPGPWACDGTAYVTQYGGDFGSSTALAKVTLGSNGTYQFTNLAVQPNAAINGIGFRTQDGYMYAFDDTTHTMVKIADNGDGTASITQLPAVVGLPPTFGAYAGAFLPNGEYFVWGTPPESIGYVIDVSGPVPTVVQTVTPSFDASFNGFPIGDFAVSPVDGNLYASINSVVYQLNLSGGTLSLGPAVGAGQGSGGAQWFGPDGPQGTLFQISGTQLWATDMATGKLSDVGPLSRVPTNADGTSCPNTLALTKDAAPRTVDAGGQLTYTYTITARGLTDTPDSFTDTLPAGMTYVPGGVTINGTFGSPNNYGGTNTLSIAGTIPHNTTVTITAKVQVSPDAACNANVANQASATMQPAGLPAATVVSDDPTTTPFPDPTVVHVDCAADVGITKTAAMSPIVPGGDETYTLTETNHGPSTATNAKVSDPLPKALTFISTSQGCSFANGLVSCSAGDLAPGASKSFQVTAHVPSSVSGSCQSAGLSNTATVASTTPDPDSTNNSATVCPPIAPSTDLEITKSASAPTITVGGQVMYTLVVINKGPSDASGVSVTDPTPAGLTVVSAQSGQESCTAAPDVKCKLGTIVAGGSAQILVTATVASSAGGQTITNCASVSGDQPSSSGKDRSCVPIVVPPVPPPPSPPPTQPKADLGIVKHVNHDKAHPGQTLTYTLVVTNHGPDAAANAKITDTPSLGLSATKATPSQGTCTVGHVIRCSFGTLPDGKRVTIKVTAKVMRTGTERNVATTTTTSRDTNSHNNLDKAKTKLVATLQLHKTVFPKVVTAGQRVVYHLRVTNPNGITLRNVKVCDALPLGLTFSSSTPKAKLAGGRECWTYKRLSAHGSKIITMHAQTLKGAHGRLINHATATATGVRPAKAKATVRVKAAPKPPPTPVTG